LIYLVAVNEQTLNIIVLFVETPNFKYLRSVLASSAGNWYIFGIWKQELPAEEARSVYMIAV
jgi:hypothetical protein